MGDKLGNKFLKDVINNTLNTISCRLIGYDIERRKSTGVSCQ